MPVLKPEYQQNVSNILTLLLAWRMAKKLKKDESEAIRKCAKQLVHKVNDKKLKHLMKSLGKVSTSAQKRIIVINRLEQGLELI